MKKIIAVCVFLAISSSLILSGCGNAGNPGGASGSGSIDAAKVIGDIPTIQEFSDESVNESDLKSILMAGINAPSAMNGQPWHFSVVTNKDILQQIAGDMGGGKPPKDGKNPFGGKPPMDGDKKDMPAPPPGGSMSAKAGIADAPVAVIISCKEGAEFDAGLACESMADMANVIGYGTKIISSPTIALNGEKKEEYKKLLQIPDDQSAAAVLLIGHAKDAADSVTGATERNPYDETVDFIE